MILDGFWSILTNFLRFCSKWFFFKKNIKYLTLHVHTYINTYIHIHTYIYIHSYTYIHIHTYRFAPFVSKSRTATAYAFSNDFGLILAKQMTYFSENVNADAMSKVKGDVEDLKQLMVDRVEKVCYI